MKYSILFIYLKLAIRCKNIFFLKKDLGSGSGSKFNCVGRVGSDDLGYGPGSDFSLKPVQTSTSHILTAAMGTM